jgi:hypothetical protein
MITFDKINRRAHLYLGLCLMPWLLMYGVSSFIVIHQSWFPKDRPAREVVVEKAYAVRSICREPTTARSCARRRYRFSRTAIWKAPSG